MIIDENRPSLIDLFSTALEYTRQEDINRNSDTSMKLFLERSTFHERVVSNFIIVASGYYKKEEIKSWMEENLFD